MFQISSYVCPGNFELLGVPPFDMIEDVCAAWREAGLDFVECLRRGTEITNEFQYEPTIDQDIRLRDRVKPRRINTKLVPVKNRTLAEILDPQPRCSIVLHKLLEWIDRCDYASQNGEMKPPCKQLNGDQIIPTDEDDLWWLTELSRRKIDEKKDDPPPGDVEDGPASDGGQEEVAALTTDDEPTDSDDDDVNKDMMTVETYTDYFEEQRGTQCAVHALNNALGRHYCTMDDMRFALMDYLETTKIEGSQERIDQHSERGGFYSSEIIAHSLLTVSMHNVTSLVFFFVMCLCVYSFSFVPHPPLSMDTKQRPHKY